MRFGYCFSLLLLLLFIPLDSGFALLISDYKFIMKPIRVQQFSLRLISVSYFLYKNSVIFFLLSLLFLQNLFFHFSSRSSFRCSFLCFAVKFIAHIICCGAFPPNKPAISTMNSLCDY